MYNHAPKDYKCPICLAVNDVESDATMIKQDDIFYHDDLVMAVINSKWIGKNVGHVIIVPIEHYENLYDLPENVANRIMKVAKEVAIAMKEIRKCDGIMLKQNNEPASDQHAFHFHLHIFPRFENDKIHENMNNYIISKPEERKQYTAPLKEYFKKK